VLLVTSPAFRYDLDQERGLLVAHGDLDEPATVGLRETINQATSDLTGDLTIDLGDVDFLPSSAIGVIATAQATARRNGATISFVAADGTVAQRVLAVCGLDYLEAVPEA
jgi:anti-anti-sigma factor